MIPVKYVPQSCFGCFRIVGAEYALVQLGELPARGKSREKSHC